MACSFSGRTADSKSADGSSILSQAAMTDGETVDKTDNIENCRQCSDTVELEFLPEHRVISLTEQDLGVIPDCWVFRCQCGILFSSTSPRDEAIGKWNKLNSK